VTSLELLYSGKAKSVFRTGNPGELLLEFRDDITAFDGGKKALLAEKGRLNARVSAFFFRYLEKHGVKTHFIRLVDPEHMLVRELRMIPLEVIVRNIAAGSMVRNYPILEGTVLEPPVIVIDYKDDGRHDPMLNDDLCLALGIVTGEELAAIKSAALEINRTLGGYLLSRGIRLVDFKIEFGRFRNEILLGDEISMDSMRLWSVQTGESMDKDVYRFDKGDVIAKYRSVADLILSGDEG
jgi:phosphoribosylaminoimidazole-succinocarboxamide synthase